MLGDLRISGEERRKPSLPNIAERHRHPQPLQADLTPTSLSLSSQQHQPQKGLHVCFSEPQTHPNLHRPVLVGQTAVIPSERVQIWVRLFLYGWSCPSIKLQIWVCLICVISTYSNGDVQIRVGLEFAVCLRNGPLSLQTLKSACRTWVSRMPRISWRLLVLFSSLEGPFGLLGEGPMFQMTIFQEWPRQTKPKKGQFMNFSQGHSRTEVQCESCLFS